jgi:hypothetical protein
VTPRARPRDWSLVIGVNLVIGGMDILNAVPDPDRSRHHVLEMK